MYLGEVPYSNVKGADLLKHLNNGNQLPLPKNLPEELYVVTLLYFLSKCIIMLKLCLKCLAPLFRHNCTDVGANWLYLIDNRIGLFLSSS